MAERLCLRIIAILILQYIFNWSENSLIMCSIIYIMTLTFVVLWGTVLAEMILWNTIIKVYTVT
jgi:hypothetical protein